MVPEQGIKMRHLISDYRNVFGIYFLYYSNQLRNVSTTRFLVLTPICHFNCGRHYDPCGGHRKVPMWEGAEKNNKFIEEKA
jgi:hypothetical protein